MDVERWIDAWRGPLTGLFAGWGVPWPEASELAADALVEGYLARDRLAGDAHDVAVAGPWLRGIARNLFRARGRRLESDAAKQRELRTAPAWSDARANCEDDERLAALRRGIERLPRALREALYLFYLEETSVRSVAALLGVSEKTVEGRLHRARMRLRLDLAPRAAKEARKDLKSEERRR